MDIDTLRHFFQQELPRHLITASTTLWESLAYVPHYVYLTIIALLLLIFMVLARRVVLSTRMDDRRGRIAEKLASVRSVQDLIPLLYHHFKEIDPSLRHIGIYAKSHDSFRLLNAESLEDGATESALDTMIAGKAGYDRVGRFHYFTYIPESQRVAVRLVSLNKVEAEDIRPELHYLTAYLESFIQTDSLKTELFKSRLIEATREVFLSSSQKRTEYFTFIGNIIRKAISLDGLSISAGDGEVIIGSVSYPESQSRVLHVRNADIRIRICRGAGLSQEDMVSVGRFLDLISATLALYTDKVLVYNYVYFLETAVSIQERSDRYYHGHSDMVAAICLAVARQLGFDDVRLLTLQYAAKLHDIGMMGDLLELAGKDMRFTDREYALLRYHPLTGGALVAPTESVHPVAAIIMQHHEALDGTGYPNGICGDNMLPEARILALAEIVTGLISDRAHRKGLVFEDAVAAVSQMVPRKIDPYVFSAFVEAKATIQRDLRRITEASSV